VVALEWADANQEVMETNRRANVTLTDYGRSQRLVQQSIDDATDAQREQTETLRKARDQMRLNADATYGLYDAEAALESAIERARDEASREGATMMSVRGSLVDVARAADEQAQAQLALKGRTMDTKVGMDQWTLSMLTTASTLKGPMRDEVLNHVARVSGIPRDVLTHFRAEMDMDALAALERDLEWLARQRFVRFAVTAAGTRYAQGTPAAGAPGGPALTGENGPEVVDLPKGAKVYPASMTPGLLGSRGGATVINLTQNFPRGMSGSDVIAAQRQYARRNGEIVL